jgi:hypothetical protein
MARPRGGEAIERRFENSADGSHPDHDPGRLDRSPTRGSVPWRLIPPILLALVAGVSGPDRTDRGRPGGGVHRHSNGAPAATVR